MEAAEVPTERARAWVVVRSMSYLVWGAEDTTVTLTSLEENMIAPDLRNDDGPFTIPPHGGTYSLPVLTYSATASRARANFSWFENGEERHSSHTVSF